MINCVIFRYGDAALQTQIGEKLKKRINLPNLFHDMDLQFEFAIDRCPSETATNNGWYSFQYSDWEAIKPQFEGYVKTLPPEHTVALLDGGKVSFKLL